MLSDLLPALPFTTKAIEIALNGMTVGMLLPFAALGFKRLRNVLDLITLMVFSAAIGLLISNLWLYFFLTTGVNG